MPSVVIIHAPEDALPARALAEKIRQAGLEVQAELAGDSLREAVRRAAVTIALWSPRSVAQPHLSDEASYASSVSSVVHATMQNAPAPHSFRTESVVNLTGWRGEDDFEPWRDLAHIITQAAGVAPLPPPVQRPASGFFQPGSAAAAARAARTEDAPRRQPRPLAPETAPSRSAERLAPHAATDAHPDLGREPRRGGFLLVGGVIVALLAVGIGGYFVWGQLQSSQAASQWESVPQDDPAALRAFLAGGPGEFRDRAEAALAQLEQRTYAAAREADNIPALEAFLEDFPSSDHALAARGRIAELRSLPSGPTGLAPAESPLLTDQPDPDLVPPDSTDSGGGPAALTPPAPEEPVLQEPGTEEPATPPTN